MVTAYVREQSGWVSCAEIPFLHANDYKITITKIAAIGTSDVYTGPAVTINKHKYGFNFEGNDANLVYWFGTIHSDYSLFTMHFSIS